MFRQTVAVLAVLIAGAVPIAARRALPPIFGAYYPGGSAERYPVSSIPAERLTHLFYAFSTIEDGRCAVGAEAPKNFAALAELKKAHPHPHADFDRWLGCGWVLRCSVDRGQPQAPGGLMHGTVLRSPCQASMAWISTGSSRSVAGRRSWRIARRIAPT